MKAADDFTCDVCHVEVTELYVIEGEHEELCKPCGEAQIQAWVVAAQARAEERRVRVEAERRQGDVRFAGMMACAWAPERRN